MIENTEISPFDGVHCTIYVHTTYNILFAISTLISDLLLVKIDEIHDFSGPDGGHTFNRQFYNRS